MTEITTCRDRLLPHESNTRREFLTQIAAAGIGVASLSMALPAQAAVTPDQPAADSGHAYPLTKIYPKTGKELSTGIIGLVTVSNIISGIGVNRAANAKVKEFANFELRETIAVLSILKGGGTITPPRTATLKSILASVESARRAAFDERYMGAELAGHEWLRDTAEIYLKNSLHAISGDEKHARDIATLSLALFEEHVVLAKEIISAIK
jgi:hypothetical protein